MDEAWDWVEEELKKIQQDIPQDPEMAQVVDAISVADFWKRRYDEEQMLWERKLEIKEDEKNALQQQSQSHEIAIKEMNWKLKELERRWEQEKLLLEDRLKTKEVEAALDKKKFQLETFLETLEKENKDLKTQLSQSQGVEVFKPRARETQVQDNPEAVTQQELERLKQLEKEKNSVADALKEKEAQFEKEREKWKTVESEVGQMSSQMAKRLGGLKEREQEHFSLLEDLARGFAHRVRNYLGIMSGTIQLCISNYKMEPELEDQLKIVDQNVQDMLGSIEDFLNFARIPEMSIKKINVNQLLENTIHIYDNKFSIQNISLTKDFSKDVPPLDGDQALLSEALQNLLQNSLEAMPQGGRLNVVTAYDKAGDVITINIADSGAGISEAHLKKIFQPYFSTKKGRKGLSLTASKRIVNLHKGTLNVESVKGKSTTATINFFLEPSGPLSSDDLRR